MIPTALLHARSLDLQTVETLSAWSNTLLNLAIAIYAAGFVLFALDLAGRSARAGQRTGASAVGATRRQLVTAGSAAQPAGEGAAPVLSEVRAPAADAWRDSRATPALSWAMWVTGLAFALHLAATVLRGIAAERVPWANMFEFSLTFTLLIVLVFLVVGLWLDLRFLGTFITGFATLWLGLTTVAFHVDVVPLVPALQSPWLVIHVFVASLSTGFLALGFGLSLLQLLQLHRARIALSGRRSRLGFLQALPDAARLEDLAYRINVVGFILWTFTLIAGAIWAERAWGRYWGWDTKEVWTFIIWVVYAGYIHARATRGWRGTPSAWLSMIGFATVIFNFAIVNVFFKGLHAYSGL